MYGDTIDKLKKIAKSKVFKKDEYICYEGQPGNEMYFVLKGSIGVNVTSAIGTLNQIAVIGEGDFFGEMAIFDNLPRSASGIALEETVCVMINKENLQKFMGTCPEVAKRMMEKMSERIRKLDDELYKNNRFVSNRLVPLFEMPEEYGFSHAIKAPYHNPQYLTEYRQVCPICGKEIKVTDLRRNIMKIRNISMDCRVNYAACDPIWFEVMSCPYCCYTNHYLSFFKINQFEKNVIEHVLEDEHLPVVKDRNAKRTEFDVLVMKYLQAIHINEHINAGDNVLLGSLWRNLYWLSRDAEDKEFAAYCANRALEKFVPAIDEKQIADATTRCTIALSTASLLAFTGQRKEVEKYVDMALECPDEVIKEKALCVKERLNQK